MVLCVEDIVPLEIPEMFIECGMSVARSFLTSFLVTRETSEPESRNNRPLYSDESEQISARVVAEMSLDDRVSRWMTLGMSTGSAMSFVVALCNRVSRCQTVEVEIEIFDFLLPLLGRLFFKGGTLIYPVAIVMTCTAGDLILFRFNMRHSSLLGRLVIRRRTG